MLGESSYLGGERGLPTPAIEWLESIYKRLTAKTGPSLRENGFLSAILDAVVWVSLSSLLWQSLLVEDSGKYTCSY